jgi:hypothetical protein
LATDLLMDRVARGVEKRRAERPTVAAAVQEEGEEEEGEEEEEDWMKMLICCRRCCSMTHPIAKLLPPVLGDPPLAEGSWQR